MSRRITLDLILAVAHHFDEQPQYVSPEGRSPLQHDQGNLHNGSDNITF